VPTNVFDALKRNGKISKPFNSSKNRLENTMEKIMLKEDSIFNQHVKKAQDSLNDEMKEKFKKLSTS